MYGPLVLVETLMRRAQMLKTILCTGLLLGISPAFIHAQSAVPPKDATDVTTAEMDAVRKAQTNNRYDQVIKVVDIGKYNVAIALTHHESPTPNASTHEGITEVYIV